jgi:RNA polymerase sigma-70 factor (ECF subfamily)
MLTKVLHARTIARVRRHIQAVLGGDDERDDVLQEVLMRTVLKIGTLREAASLDAWVGRVTQNAISNFLRRRRSRRHISWEASPERDDPTFQGDSNARDLASRALRVIDLLPERERALLTRYWFSPATIDSLATEEGCPRITMRRRLARARTSFEKLARRDPALAPCFDDPEGWWGRWRRHVGTRRLHPSRRLQDDQHA